MGEREIRVIRISNDEIVRRVDVTGRREDIIEKCMMGMLKNMNQDEYRIEDSDWVKK